MKNTIALFCGTFRKIYLLHHTLDISAGENTTVLFYNNFGNKKLHPPLLSIVPSFLIASPLALTSFLISFH
jgi:hypothetical protein